MPRTSARADTIQNLDYLMKLAMMGHLLLDSSSDSENNSDDLQPRRQPDYMQYSSDDLQPSSTEDFDFMQSTPDDPQASDSYFGEFWQTSSEQMTPYPRRHRSDPLDDISGDDNDFEEIYYLLASMQHDVSSKRYSVLRRNLPRCKESRYSFFLELSNLDFRQLTRMTKSTFWFVHGLIQNDRIFHNNSWCPQAPVHWQLACTLDRFGSDGGGISVDRSKYLWELGHGTVLEYCGRVTTALWNIQEDHVHWPDNEERAEISARMARQGFKDVVGFVDGTTFPLHCKPSEHGNAYMDRKKRYSVNAQVVCDDHHRIRHFLTGMPGSCHDSRIFSQSPLVTDPERAFSSGQFLLADSGYAASRYLVPAYKDRMRDFRHDPTEPIRIEKFNTYLAKARVVNEHCIGILKARWSSLRGLRINLLKPDDIVSVQRQTTACVILHNIALQVDPWEDDVDSEDINDSSADNSPVDMEGRDFSAGQQKRLQVRLAVEAFHSGL